MSTTHPRAEAVVAMSRDMIQELLKLRATLLAEEPNDTFSFERIDYIVSDLGDLRNHLRGMF